MHNKIAKLHKKLEAQFLWAQNVDEKEIYCPHRFDLFYHKVSYDFLWVDRYMKTLDKNDYDYIVENILPAYEWRTGE